MAPWTLAASLATLRREVDAAFPGRSKISDGTIGDTAHAARKSDHNPDEHQVVRAWDCTRDVVAGIDVADYLAEWLRRVRDPRIKYLIFRRRICSSYPVGGAAPYVWRPYDGLNAHEHHLHISVQPAPVGDDARAWGFSLTPPLEDDMPLDDSDVTKILEGKIDATYTDAKGDRISLGEAVGLAQRWALHGALRAQALEQQLAALDAKVSALGAPTTSAVDVQALAAAIAPLLPAAPTAEQVADVLAARLQQ